MISQRLIKHTLIIVTMNRKVKEDSKGKFFCRYFADFDMKNEEI